MDEYVPCTRCESGAHDRVVILPYSETPTKKGPTMKKFLTKTQQFLDDHAEAITVGVAATTFTALTMYLVAAYSVDAVRVTGAGKKLDADGNLLVKVWLSNGAWSEYIWSATDTK